MRKALCVGIDSYEKIKDLHGCVNDANGVKAALDRNGDGTLNFSTKLLCATSEASYITREGLKDAVQDLFRDESEVAVFIMPDMVLMMHLVDIYVLAKWKEKIKGYH